MHAHVPCFQLLACMQLYVEMYMPSITQQTDQEALYVSPFECG